MTTTESAPPGDTKPMGWRRWARGALNIVIIVGVMAGVLFAAAGTVDWPAAWLLAFLYAVFLLVILVWGARNAPGLLQERGRIASNVKGWDKVVNILYTFLLIALFIVAGLDVGRFQWSAVPLAVQALGFAGAALAGWIIWSTMAANAYLSRWARIQNDRGQTVVTGGPYRYVRHPMYAAIMLLMVSLALALGSWWALVPGALIAALFVIRTALEDRMLHQELDGYREYAAQVRYRLLPFIW